MNCEAVLTASDLCRWSMRGRSQCQSAGRKSLPDTGRNDLLVMSCTFRSLHKHRHIQGDLTRTVATKAGQLRLGVRTNEHSSALTDGMRSTTSHVITAIAAHGFWTRSTLTARLYFGAARAAFVTALVRAVLASGRSRFRVITLNSLVTLNA